MSDVAHAGEPATLAIAVDRYSLFYGVLSTDHQLLRSERVRFIDCVTPQDYKECILKHEALHNNYAAVKLSVKTIKSVLRQVIEPISDSCKQASTSIDKIPSHDAQILWHNGSNLLRALADLFPGRQVRNYGTVMAHYLYPTVADTVAIHIDQSSLHVISYKSDQLCHYKMYSAHTKEDYLYLICEVYRITHQNPATTTLKVAGDLYLHSDLYLLLKKYIRNIEFISPELLQLKTSLPDSVKHRYFDLFSTALCV